MNKTIMILAIAIPLLVLGYVFYSNFLVSQDFNYFYDIGSEQDNYLSPVGRISDKVIEGDLNYRNLTSQLVYFTVPIPSGSSNFWVEMKVKNDFPTNGKMRLGSQDSSNWSYKSQTSYNSLFQKLAPYKNKGESPKIYRINQNLPLVSSSEEIPRNSIVMTDLLLNPEPNLETFQIEDITINTTLRGSHTFYIYLKDSLNLKVKKQDLNWYNGSDEFEISLYDLKGNPIANSVIPDDGITAINRNQAIIQPGYLHVEDLDSGIYKLQFSDFDGLIRQISLNTNKIVTQKIFLADNEVYNGITTEPSIIYFQSINPSYINFNTYHIEGFQNIFYGEEILEINSKNSNDRLLLEPGNYTFIFQKNDIVVNSLGWMSFSKDSYFNPFLYFVISPGDDFSRVDYVVTNYNPVQEENEWLTLNGEFNLTGLYLKDRKLSMLIDTPHLSPSSENTNTQYIPIDWINITVHKDGWLW